jgi:hypothetical protein
MNIDLQSILEYLPATHKDARRIGLFVAVVGAKATQLATADSTNLVIFLERAAALVSRWIDKSRKFQFPIEETRQFAKDWNLDSIFINAMG